MDRDTIQEKHEIHALVDRLAPSQITAVRNLLEAMIDPVARSIANAPIDDEPLTDADRKALDEAAEWIEHNKAISHEQVLAELGISSSEIDRH